jgi:hypothetical protein
MVAVRAISGKTACPAKNWRDGNENQGFPSVARFSLALPCRDLHWYSSAFRHSLYFLCKRSMRFAGEDSDENCTEFCALTSIANLNDELANFPILRLGCRFRICKPIKAAFSISPQVPNA